MPTKAELHKQNQEVKRDIISRVTSSVMHLLHDSCLFGTRLWPKNGFQHGYGGEFTKVDTVAVGISIGYNHQVERGWQSICFNIITNKLKRGQKQAIIIDSIMDHAIYDDIYIEGHRNEMVPYEYRFRYSDWPYKTDTYYYQLGYNFTINPIASSPII